MTKQKQNQTQADDTKLIEKTGRDIRSRLASLDAHDAVGRYDIGEAVEAFRKKVPAEKYDKKYVTRLAKAAGVSGMALYNYANVARAWTKPAFDDVARRGSVEGIRFSHFVELARIQDEEARAALAEEAIAKRMSVRDLRAKIGGEKPATAAAPAAPPPNDLLTEADLLLERITADGGEAHAAAVEGLRGRIEAMVKELQERAELLAEARTMSAIEQEAAQ